MALNPKTGETVKTLKIGSSVLLAPIAMGSELYLVTDEAQVVAIR